MAHELTFNGLTGKAEMAYANAVPWHGLGQKVEANAPIEEWMVQGGLNWNIERSVAQFTNGSLRDYPAFLVLHRSDTHEPLSIVSKDYKVVQPKAMLEFYRDLVETSGFSIETVGTLKGGRRIWALAKTNAESDIVGNDNVKGYLLLVTSCDGSLATTAQFTSVRVVCNNTLGMSLAQEKDKVKVRHSSVFNPTAVKAELGLMAQSTFDSFVDRMKRLSDIKVDQAMADRFVRSIISAKGDEEEVRKSKGYTTVMGLFQGAGRGATMDGVKGTAWGFLNAVTEYADFHIRAQSSENRLNSSWFGSGAAMKNAALDLLESQAYRV